MRHRTLPILSLLTLAIAALMTMVSASHVHANNPRVIAIRAKRFEFSPAEVTLHKGERVELQITSDDVSHGLKVRALDVNAQLDPGKTTLVQLQPDHVGRFEGRCSEYCGVGHGGMTFVVTVVE